MRNIISSNCKVGKLRIILALILLGTLASCTLPTRYERNPAKAGFGRDDIKKSRCACMPIYVNGEWL